MGIKRLSEFWPEWSVKEVLGEGSYGKVYRTLKSEGGLNSESAVKVISIPNSSGELRSLYSEGMSTVQAKTYLGGIVTDFINEIKLMENLKTAANVVTVEDYKVLEKKDEIGWDIYIRMELLKPFDRVMTERGFDEDEVVKLGIDICTALEACSRHRIIHRDIKPANIFLSKFGDYKIGDFGIAKELEKTAGTMSSKGTYSYMAPEVAHGLKYDHTVDIYSLGIVMYVLLNNNRQPFIDPYSQQITYNDKKVAVDKRLSGHPLPKPCKASAALSEIILTACSYDPQKRYRSPSALKNALNYYKSSKLLSGGGAVNAEFFASGSFEYNSESEETVAFAHNSTATENPESAAGPASGESDNLLERVFIFIEDGDWHNAARYCERVLDNDPKNALAYLGKLMISLGVRNIKNLGTLLVPFDANINYKKIMQFGEENLKQTVYDYNCNVIYNSAVKRYGEGDLIGAAILFKRISGYYDADRYYISLISALEKQDRENDEEFEEKYGAKAVKKFERGICLTLFLFIFWLGIAGLFYLIYNQIIYSYLDNLANLWIIVIIWSILVAVFFLYSAVKRIVKRSSLIKNYNFRSGEANEIKEFLASSGLIMVTDKVYYVNSLGTYVCGIMRSGSVSVGDSIVIHGIRYSIHDIESQLSEKLEASAGEYVGFLVSKDKLQLQNKIPVFKY